MQRIAARERCAPFRFRCSSDPNLTAKLLKETERETRLSNTTSGDLVSRAGLLYHVMSAVFGAHASHAIADTSVILKKPSCT